MSELTLAAADATNVVDRPNILVLLCDQMRPFELGCYGHPVVRTPNLDRLAAGGVRFEQAVTPNPLCTPARSALLAGQYSRSCTGMLGNVGNPEEGRRRFPDATLAELLKAAGYETRLEGKWHLGPNPRLMGFDQTIYPSVDHRNCDQTYFDGLGGSWTEHGYCPDAEVARTRDFLLGPHDKPFFMLHSMCLPHMPFYDVPERYRSLYAAEHLPLRPNTRRDGQLFYDERAFKIYLYDFQHYRMKYDWADRLPDGYDLHRLHADYAGAISAVDEQVGAVLAALDEAGLREKTIIVFVSDHGDNLGSHHRWNKHSINEEALRIPWMISWGSALMPRVVSRHVASLVDVAPTLLSLAGLPAALHMQGRDLTPVLSGSRERIGEGEAYIENIGGEIAIRTPTHLCGVQTDQAIDAPDRRLREGVCWFHDLLRDPYEQHDLASDPSQAALAWDLRERLLEWNRATPWMAGTRGGLYGNGETYS